MLRYMEEEEAFWTLCMIIECLLPLDYYACMVGILVDQGVLKKLISKTLPNLWETLVKHKVDPNLFTVQWFVCLFAQSLDLEVLDEVWDHFFLYGGKTLFKAGLALLTLVEKDLVACGEFGNSEERT